jgi:ABC-type cobalamin transport system permease subunit
MEPTDKTSHKWNEWKFRDIVFGVVVPTIVAFLIVSIAMSSSPGAIGLKYILLEAIVVVGVPMLIGLVWNQWAGGASGFLMGSLYTLYFADQVYASQGSSDISLLGNLVSAMLIGYVAGAINKRSDSYKRMLIAGVTAGIVGSLIVVFASNFSSILGPATLGGAVTSFLPRVLAGILVPLVARAFLRHGKNQKKKAQST